MDFEKCTLVELRQLAKEKGVKNVSKLKKEDLIDILSDLNPKEEKENSKVNNLSNDSSAYKITNADDEIVEGILEVLPDGYGFLRGENYLSSPKDVYISPVQIRRFRLDKGDKIKELQDNLKKEKNFQL